MSGWPIPMSTDPSCGAENARIASTLHNDRRLLAGVSAIVAHAARRAGLPEQAQAEFAAAAAEACREAFLSCESDGGSSCAIQLVVADLSDRIEVTIESWARAGEEVAKRVKGEGVDRVDRETRDGRTRMTLVKYHDAAKSPPQL